MSSRVSGFFKGTRALMAAAKAAVAEPPPPLVFEINLRVTVHSNGQVSSLQIPATKAVTDFDRVSGAANNRKGSPVKTPATVVAASPTQSQSTTTGSENGDKEEETKKVVEEVNNQKSKGKRSRRRSSTGEETEVGSPTTPRRLGGMMQVLPISPALSEFLGVPETSRNHALKKVWEHIRQHNLQNPTNKKAFACDDQLKTIFEGKDEAGTLEIVKLLSPHFVKTT